ncbi:hypothetical protein roselon_00353 [Roseibacterium elongatum DSM 19469]|uniref:N-acetyltransferase domain-containing protein n=1 Tax=Roseicyclus elongatus DSM 19469 TaxID=1294273 RepID=W8RP48_9RHOB|nr:GNAT family N-acetyltransferase [Roseibacterium elongatum]AHM02798.1 hypothetical protein roselon_00353 [Roseibacterium elongatum DSM 19469]
MYEILKYTIDHENGLLDLLTAEPDWDTYTAPDAIAVFRQSLRDGETLVCKDGDAYCGYLRAIKDGLGLYVSELYVGPPWRSRGIGRRLLDEIKQHNLDREVYVLSDEDAYYHNLGYRRIGSVFEIGLGNGSERPLGS